MKTLFALLALIPTLSHAAADFTCEGREGVRGTIKIHVLESGHAAVKGSYNWDSESGQDTANMTVNCAGNMNNYGRSGNKAHDYYDLKGCPQYLRTAKDFANGDGGWVSLVISGPSDHDSSGYIYANFFCK